MSVSSLHPHRHPQRPGQPPGPLADRLKARLAAFHYELADLGMEARARQDRAALRQVAAVQNALASAEVAAEVSAEVSAEAASDHRG
ncbi:hypothetical protein [Roseospirillum parvum]|uniref:Uncharacterized protein n=1 Tax=Roseospirillum parvum TaxID=83401 RepID=A0A1G8EDX6_9PROT|nr:hypothetical protein [Roseospirillum parvum]SDH68115.1 hypothetical protein SAMN05421742_1109 [Roseospirillum parvum]